MNNIGFENIGSEKVISSESKNAQYRAIPTTKQQIDKKKERNKNILINSLVKLKNSLKNLTNIKYYINPLGFKFFRTRLGLKLFLLYYRFILNFYEVKERLKNDY